MDSGDEIKIGLVTYFRENYGSALQCFATKKYLEDKGIQCQVIEKKSAPFDKVFIRCKNILYHVISSFKYRGYFTHYIDLRQAMSKEKKLLTVEASKKLNQFINVYIQPKEFFWAELKNLNRSKNYKAFIAGSDQIWNISLNIDSVYFLRFCDKSKRIAFAPSFGVGDVPLYNVNTLKRGLAGFDFIAVREETGECIVKKFSSAKCIRIADPVFLLTKEEWIEFTKKREIPQFKYVFAYFLNEPSDLAIDIINYLCLEKSCRVILFSYNHDKFIRINKSSQFNGDPIDFVNLIANAEMVCTDSFHATLFSVILEKQFFTFNRQYLHKSPQTSRLKDMLTRYGVYDHFIETVNDAKNAVALTTPFLREIVEEERSKTINYLESELGKRIDKKIQM